mmetsp:Transcript_16156/g.25845  ORF Transcript_16156/g.25845 Transcript_16156/m.25845 type:complete len:106 (-) Transcript_16156:1737-2054(-)
MCTIHVAHILQTNERTRHLYAAEHKLCAPPPSFPDRTLYPTTCSSQRCTVVTVMHACTDVVVLVATIHQIMTKTVAPSARINSVEGKANLNHCIKPMDSPAASAF